MSKLGKWSPVRIPDAFRNSTDKTKDSGDPMNSWDASDWDDPDSGGGWFPRLKPHHMGQWLILGAAVTLFVGIVLWLGRFFPLTHQNPWVISIAGHIAIPLVTYVVGREHGFLKNKDIDWSFVTTGRSVRTLPGKFAGRFGNSDIQHVKFNLMKSRAYGAFKFSFVKLGDLEADRDKLISKATGTNRGPDSPAVLMLPGPLSGENSDTVLGRVFGVHGGAVEYHDSGQETDMRVTPPSTLDEDIAADVLTQLELYDQRIIPELKSEVRTVETQKNRYKQRAEAERDPELDRLLSSVDTIASIINGDRRRSGSNTGGGDDELDEINELVRDQVEGT